jgi:hypothetical protein
VSLSWPVLINAPEQKQCDGAVIKGRAFKKTKMENQKGLAYMMCTFFRHFRNVTVRARVSPHPNPVQIELHPLAGYLQYLVMQHFLLSNMARQRQRHHHHMQGGQLLTGYIHTYHIS